jgi:transcriptional regulator with XRE-family HTH domain
MARNSSSKKLSEKERNRMPSLTQAQCRAARALLDWTQEDLANATALSAVSIRAFERGADMRESNRKLLRFALERAGVEFIDENGGGSGARLKERETPTPERRSPRRGS